MSAFRYVWVSDRVPKKTKCAWCQEPFAATGYVGDTTTGLAYCSPDCWDRHERVSRAFIKSYNAHMALLEDKRETQV